ncbi:MAG: hypothetical protein CVU54_11225 [Deltaproteobacteria bacterium HGW-Deltaproteobacteria-12]|jgi:Zn-dependent protease with chaperone function|nr:MAG: hypothetical protein CVU54_11225 [Deltaproteobacteria bacterium HGW-Deltaproteobacteria-12]
MTNGRLTTNFFARQEQARRNCRKLGLLFAGAVLCIIAAVYFAFRLICYINLITNIITVPGPTANSAPSGSFAWWDPASFILVFSTVALFIFIASIIKMRQLQKGGGTVAEMLGGSRVPENTDDPAKRRLLNVVEEMSIASGIPVPLVYILEREQGINAFAAGLGINDAAVAITQGALDRLSRDELQGVIAHEFSHLLNGDMRLNIQLIGIIYGILIIGIIGGEILEHRRISSKSIVLFIGGILLTVIGYIGTFAGRLIQSAVSREKEFLADASAVKFTRNPLGLASALKKIGGCIYGSQITSATAKQASHLFFGQSDIDVLFPAFLATHPPLIKRIQLLDPSFDGTFPAAKDIPPRLFSPKPDAAVSFLDKIHGSPDPPIAKDIIDYVGNPAVNKGSAILASLPDQIKAKLRTPDGAATVICALLTPDNNTLRKYQFHDLQHSLVMPGHEDDFLRLCDQIAGLKNGQRLPLVELALPSLRSLTIMERRNFLETINSQVNADGKITLPEFCVQLIVQQYLGSKDESIFGETVFSHLSQVGYQIFIILRMLANAGNKGNADAARMAFNAGVARIPELACKNPDYYYTEDFNFAEIKTALKKMDCSSFKIKQVVVDACSHCAFADRRITVTEAELLRVLSLALHCPLPPFAPEY